MIKRVKRVNLDKVMIDDIWLYWNRISEKSMSRTSAMDKVADIVGCSHTTVYRVIAACEAAHSGEVLKYDRKKYPNHMMVDYINQKFASHNLLNATLKDAAKDEIVSKESISDTKLLANSISELAAAIREQNQIIKILSKVHY